MADLQAASAVGQGKLYRVYDELLRERGIVSAQVLLTFFDVGHRGHYLNARRTLGRLLDWRVVPVVNENDTTATEEISFGDNDFLAAQIAILVGADRLVLLTNQDGLHTADPRSDPASELVREVDDVRELAGYSIGHAPSELGSGGMRSKVVAAEMATAAGIPATICSGLRDGVLARALAGEAEGTRFARAGPAPLELRAVAEVREARERRRCVVDAGAARALREGGASLLPVGVVEVEGAFGEGDAIEIRDAGGALAKGISSYAAADVRRAMGRQTAAVRELLPRAADEVVHRDYLVLL